MRDFSSDWEQAIARHTFRCARCGKVASSVALIVEKLPTDGPRGAGSGSGGLIAETGFFGEWWQAVARGALAPVADALRTGSASALYDIEPLWAPFYCPDCRLSYCDEHWDIRLEFDEDWPDWYDCAMGTCPSGHTRMVDD